MSEMFERVWSATRLRYPQHAHIPSRDTLAALQLQEDERRRTVTNMEQYNTRRRTTVGMPRNSLLRELQAASAARERRTSRDSRRASSASSRPRTPTKTPTGPEPALAAQRSIRTIEEGSERDTMGSRGTRSKSIKSIPSFIKETGGRRKFGTIRQEEPGLTTRQYPVVIHSEFHRCMFDFCESRIFSGFILMIILLNTAMLLAQTFLIVQVRFVWYAGCVDNAFLGIYIFEMVLKLFVWRLKYFNEGWNWLDFTIVVFNIIDFALPLVIQNVGNFNGAAIFRLLRIFRAIRALRALRVLRTIRYNVERFYFI